MTERYSLHPENEGMCPPSHELTNNVTTTPGQSFLKTILIAILAFCLGIAICVIVWLSYEQNSKCYFSIVIIDYPKNKYLFVQAKYFTLYFVNFQQLVRYADSFC